MAHAPWLTILEPTAEAPPVPSTSSAGVHDEVEQLADGDDFLALIGAVRVIAQVGCVGGGERLQYGARDEFSRGARVRREQEDLERGELANWDVAEQCTERGQRSFLTHITSHHINIIPGTLYCIS